MIGAAYSERKDKYGLPAHSHLYDECHAHIISNEAKMAKPYLRYYPFLLEETNVDYANPGLERKKIGYHAHSLSCQDDHHHGGGQGGQQDGHDHSTHAHDDPHIALHTKRLDVLALGKIPHQHYKRCG